MKLILVVLFLIVTIGLVACSSVPSGQSPVVGSYQSPQTQPKTITLSNNGLVAHVQQVQLPNTVSNSFSISIDALPQEANQLVLLFTPQKIPQGKTPMDYVYKFLEPELQTITIPTSSLENGAYSLDLRVVAKPSASDSAPWLAQVKKILIVEN